jgi:rRNA-processing protein FCF1
MRVPSLLLILSLAGVGVALFVPGLSDLLLLAGPMALASLILLWKARRSGAEAPPRWVVIDGSNVMHWADQTPRIEPLREVIAELERQGFTPGVVFDANAGYLLRGRYQHDKALGRSLGLPTDRIMVVDKGTPADPMILTAARDMGGRVVTNDRYRDWAADYPEVKEPGFLIRGGYRGDRLWLDLEEPDERP